MARETDGEGQVQSAAEQVMAGAPWQSASENPTMESLTQALVEALQNATESVNNLVTVQQSQPAAAATGAEGLLEGVTGGESVLGEVASAAGGMGNSLLPGGFLFSPIISGIMSLFGSGGSSTPAPITPFVLPPALNVDAAGGQATGGQLAGNDFGANGLPRAQTMAAASNVTVQVNAMDSRSFLDRGSDIASAVRQAMLNSHSINDVIAEL